MVFTFRSIENCQKTINLKITCHVHYLDSFASETNESRMHSLSKTVPSISMCLNTHDNWAL